MSRAPFLLSFLAGLLAATTAEACALRIVSPPKSATIDYESFGFPPGPKSIAMIVENEATSSCNLGIEIVDAIGARPPYLLAQADASIDLRVTGQSPQTSTVGSFRATIPGDAQSVITFDAEVLGEPVVAPGAYPKEFFLKFFDRDTGLKALDDAESSVTLDSPARAQVNIAGTAAHFGEGFAVDRIDFGELTSGAKRKVFIQVRANTHASVTLTSANHGALRNVTSPRAPSIPYDARLDGRLLNLSQPAVEPVAPPKTRAGASLPFEIEIGDVSKAFAGTYEDTITIEIAPY